MIRNLLLVKLWLTAFVLDPDHSLKWIIQCGRCGKRPQVWRLVQLFQPSCQPHSQLGSSITGLVFTKPSFPFPQLISEHFKCNVFHWQPLSKLWQNWLRPFHLQKLATEKRQNNLHHFTTKKQLPSILSFSTTNVNFNVSVYFPSQ